MLFRYDFQVKYTTGFKTKTADIKIIIAAKPLPYVYIMPDRDGSVNINEKVTLKGYVETYTPDTVVWWQCKVTAGKYPKHVMHQGSNLNDCKSSVARRHRMAVY